MSEINLSTFEKRLLNTWEEVFKKGQLTLWILLSLKEGPKFMSNMKDFIETSTQGSLSADDKSMYRALRRFKQMYLVDYTEKPSASGPALKVYFLTETGHKVLKAFVERNISGIYYQPEMEKLLKG